MIAEVAGPERVGAATGFAITFVASAIAVSPPLYGLVADLAGTYRAIWAVLAVVLVVALVPASARQRARRRASVSCTRIPAAASRARPG